MFEKKIYFKAKKPANSKKIRLIKYIFLILIMLFTVNVFSNIFIYPSLAKGSFLVSPLANDIIQKTVSFINSQENSVKLESIVDNALGKDKDNFGVVIRNFKTGERFYLNEDKVFDSASLYKLWVMAITFQQLNLGLLNENDTLSENISQLNTDFNISSDSAQLSDGYISESIQEALERMITASDNYSAMLLTEKVQLPNISQFLSDNDFNESEVGTSTDNPKTSAKDTASFFDKLYHDKLNNDATSNAMLELLKKQQLNGKIPKYLPENAVVAHKTGELGEVSHDAGIVYTKKGDYILVIMSKTGNSDDANEKIAEISKNVYGYFISQKPI